MNLLGSSSSESSKKAGSGVFFMFLAACFMLLPPLKLVAEACLEFLKGMALRYCCSTSEVPGGSAASPTIDVSCGAALEK